MVVRRFPSSRRHVSRGGSPRPVLVHRRVRHRLGCFPRGRSPVRFVVSPVLSVSHQSPRASSGSLCHQRISSFSLWSRGGGVLRQHHSPGVSQEAGGHSVFHSQHGGSVDSLLVRRLSDSSPSPVHSGQVERPRRLPESPEPGHRLGVDPLLRSFSSASSPVACHYRSFRYISQRPASSVLFSNGGSAVGGHRCHAPELGRSSGLCLPSFRSPLSGVGEGPAISGAEAHLSGSVLASAPVVPGSSGASGGGSLLPATKEGSAQTAPLPLLSPEPPRASADCLAYIQQSARHSGFSSAVARQLTLCRRRSTRVNCQAKWAVYRSWCHRHGHSVSQPSVSKVADFLLYLRRSLSLSYSSIASYRSMLSGVFRFILPELSSHFVLHDLLRPFRLERPLPSSCVPPWDLLLVLRFLRGPPFEPLSSCSLRDLTQKVLFLVSSATACRVGELQAVSHEVFFSGSDIYLSYLPEFKAKTESSVNPLPWSFCVHSLMDFVGDLPDELLLCPVRALRVYNSRVSSVSPCPRSLFVSPRSPSRSLSKNALSFFLQDVISRAYSSSSSAS